MNLLNNRIALITGASRGIGKAIAQRFSAEGAKVVLVASRLGSHGKLTGTLEQAAAEINSNGGHAMALACDLTDSEAREDLIARASNCFGPIDILVNNAASSRWGLPSELSSEQRNWMFDLNTNAPIELAQQALPGMRDSGTGWILNISSSTAFQPPVPYRDSRAAADMIVGYGSTKAALDRYTVGLAHELYGSGIYVNTLAPESIVLTEGARHVIDIARNNPDMAEPLETMAEAALALCSGTLTGQVSYSRQLLHSLGLPVKSLDGQQVLGDAFIAADIDGD